MAVWEPSAARAGSFWQRSYGTTLYGCTIFKGRIEESRPCDARAQEGQVEKRQRKKGNKPLAGYRNRPLGSATRWEESAKEGGEEESQP